MDLGTVDSVPSTRGEDLASLGQRLSSMELNSRYYARLRAHWLRLSLCNLV